jgi:hypothetical protein
MKKEVESWIRLEDGTISAAVTLNATYGQDQYGEPATRMVRASNVASVNQQSALFQLVILWVFTLICFHLRRV